MPSPVTPPTSTSKINLTAIAIAGLVCLTLLVGVLLLAGKSSGAGVGAMVSARPELPVFVTWRETKLPGQTQVARIWAKPDAQLPLRVVVQVDVSVTGAQKAKEIVLERRNVDEPWELGLFEGHEFVPGDRITIGHKDFSAVSSTCKSLK